MLANETDKHYRTGFVSGAFDLFHIGHLNLLRRAKERCDVLIAGVLDDAAVQYKGKWPVIPIDERLEVVGAVRYVDRAVIIQRERGKKLEMLEDFPFDVFFSGDDWLHNAEWREDERLLKERGVDLLYFPYTKNRTSSKIQEAVLPPPIHAVRPSRISNPAKAGVPYAEGFRYLFPFDRVDKGERIVLYGAGDVGEQYARQLTALDYCEAVAFVDRNHKTRKECCGLPVWSLNDLKANPAAYDRIVIASTRYHLNIATLLRTEGIPPERVI